MSTTNGDRRDDDGLHRIPTGPDTEWRVWLNDTDGAEASVIIQDFANDLRGKVWQPMGRAARPQPRDRRPRGPAAARARPRPPGDPMKLKGEARRQAAKTPFLTALRSRTVSMAQATARAGINPSTVWRWRQQDPVFDAAVVDARGLRDDIQSAMAEDALFARCLRPQASPAETIFFPRQPQSRPLAARGHDPAHRRRR